MNRWIFWINRSLMGIAGILVLSSAALWIQRPSEISTGDLLTKKHVLPKGAFALNKQAYEAIREPVFSLNFSGASLQLPDLRTHLVFCGKNSRPDAVGNLSVLHFSLGGNKNFASMKPGDRLYLVYDKKQSPCKYVFSQNNEPTSLWIETELQGNDAIVYVKMRDEKGDVIQEPESHSHFKVQEKEFSKIAGAQWEIGTYRVDGSLLARQRARWYGPDCFLERHGGEEFEYAQGKHRIDFGEGEDVYSVFVGLGDCLVWDDDRWKAVKPGEESRGKPLITVKKIEERILNTELWDVEGRSKIPMNLVRATESWTPQSLERDFRFVGARTRSQCIFEVQDERMLLRPQDWLLLTEQGWRKLTTSEEIDEYVERKMTGTLFVFDGVMRKDDRQVLVGTIFNPSRTEMETVELALQQGGVKIIPNPESDDEIIDEEDEDEDLPVAKWTVDKLGRYVE